MGQIAGEMGGVIGVVDGVISETRAGGAGELVDRLAASRDRLVEADGRGRAIVENREGRGG